jgi:hypothetical protein
MGLMEKRLELRFQRLGFAPSDYGVEAHIGTVKLNATEHPLKGVALFFSRVGQRIGTQFETFVPKSFTSEEIADVIYANFRANLKEDADECKRYLEALGVTLGAH